ncbi:type II secretion system F family protein [Nocardioides sp. ChNu-153]|uniref:type II secretion system F family protein n=1 Tax=unclassified Nocardioides TaxID=2615069 RepID=UPI00240725F1|nr:MULTISPECIES: type II secretion system F family protein [unclassified Nocardioides]MDF9715914.1 type II secretion system F family protein [Nocardioides sp. ChNu-99]MDN7122907.1 type II secretion system F family protein [Nocardioides sp. ChNu-153]
MTMLLVLGGVLLAAALVVAWLAVGRAEAEAGGITRSLALLEAMGSAPDELKQDVDKSFDERVLTPLLERFNRVGRRLTGGESRGRIQRKLDLAGGPVGWTVDKVASSKVGGAVAGFVGGCLLALLLSPRPALALLLVVGAGVLGFYAVDLWLYQRAYDRRERMQRDLADAIDLLTISVEAGLGFDAALQQVARNTDGPVAEEFARMLREMQLGKSRRAALEALRDRSPIEDLNAFVGALVQADAFGAPIGQVLRTQAGEIRVKRRQHAEKRAQQVPVKIMVPLVLFILPCLFIVVIGPAALSIIDSGFGG